MADSHIRDKVKNVVKGSILMSTEEVGVMLFGLIFYFLMIRYLGPAKYGIYAIVLGFVNIMSVIPGNWHSFFMRFIPEYQQQRKPAMIMGTYFSVLFLKLAISFVGVTVLFFLAGIIANVYKDPIYTILLRILIFTVITEGVNLTNLGFFFGMQRYRAKIFFAYLKAILKVSSIVIVVLFNLGIVGLSYGILIASTLSAIISSLYILFTLRKITSEAVINVDSKLLLKKIVGYNLPLYGANFTAVLFHYLPTIILGLFFSDYLIGLLAVALNIVFKLSVVLQSIPNALLPSFSELKASNHKNDLWRLFKYGFRIFGLILAITVTGVFIFADWFVLIVGGKEYLFVAVFLQPLAFQIFFQLVAQPIKMVQFAYEKTKQILVIIIVRFCLQMAFIFGTIWYFGIFCAVVANLASFFVSNIILFFLLRKVVSEKKSEILNLVSVELRILFIPLVVVAGWFVLNSFDLSASLVKWILFGIAIPVSVIIIWAFKLFNRTDASLLKKTFLRFVRRE